LASRSSQRLFDGNPIVPQVLTGFLADIKIRFQILFFFYDLLFSYFFLFRFLIYRFSPVFIHIWRFKPHLAFTSFFIRPLDHGELFSRDGTWTHGTQTHGKLIFKVGYVNENVYVRTCKFTNWCPERAGPGHSSQAPAHSAV
jgi:hypothetical protein